MRRLCLPLSSALYAMKTNQLPQSVLMKNKNWIPWAFLWGSFLLLQLIKPYEFIDRIWVLAAYCLFGINIVNFFTGGTMRYTGDNLDGNSNVFRRLLRLAVSVVGFIVVIKLHVFDK
jgi:hypothetical protein